MAKIKVADLAKEIGAPAKDVMSYLREKGVDVKSFSSMVDDEGIKIAEAFYGPRKEKKPAEPKRRALFDASGNPIKRKFDENGKPLPITGPVFDADGKPVQMRKQLYDADGNPIKRKYDADGNPLPITGPVYDAEGNLVQLKKRPAEAGKDSEAKAKKPVEKTETQETPAVEPKKEPEAKVEKAPEVAAPVVAQPEEPAQKPVEKTTEKSDEKPVEKPVEKAPVTERKPREANAERKPREANDNAPRRPREGAQGNYGDRRPREGAQGNYGDRRPREGAQGNYGDRRPREGAQGNYGDRRPREGAQGGYGDRRPREGAQGGYGDRRPREGAQGNYGDRRPREGAQQNGFRRPAGGTGTGNGYNNNRGFDKGGFDKGGFDKDRDNDRKVFTKKNDQRSSSSSIKADFSNEITKEQRASAYNDRNRDKNRNSRNFDRDNEMSRDGKKGASKKKDPNRKGAFIMPKPVVVKEEDPNEIKTIVVPEMITIKELADKMKQNAAAIVKKLFLAGKLVNVNSEITFEEAEEIALEYNCIVEKEVVVDVVEELMRDTEDSEDTLMDRPPVVCVMGHVDHGKTSILDAIRSTHVTQREAGGITQHIGAYMVEKNGQQITFLDTPGHEAFTAMRMRGAMATDIAVLVVAADDGVMPQTIEAINHAKAAGVSIVVAINKMDKEAANPDRVLTELSEHGLISESWGGDIVTVPVSAKTGEGIDQLLEMILLTAEVLELKSNPNRKARGIVIEAKLDKGRGPVATVLVQKGTLRVGDTVAIGASYGKIRAMINDQGRKVDIATPSTPVEILGLNSVPSAGDILVSTDSEKEARNISEAFVAQSKEKLIAETKAKLSLDGLFDQIKAGNVKELNIIVKADVAGSVEAVKQSLLKLSNDEIAVRCIHGGVGNINESDVILASASSAIIVGFNVKPDNVAKDTAEREQVDVRLYSVIYNAIDDIEAAMKGMLDPIYEEVVTGHAEVRQTFKASGLGTIAGSYVLDGKIVRNSKARITRNGEQIFEGNLASLKRMKDDVKEVNAGYECGIVFEKFNDLQEGDAIEVYIMQEVPRK